MAVRTPQFWLLWLMLFISVSAGIMIISQASPLAQQLAGLTPVAAAGVVGVLSIFNGIGRVVWAAASDYFGHARVWVALFLLEAAMLFSLPHVHATALLTLVIGLVGFAYGGGFGIMPSLTASSFGAKYMGGIYGLILLAWSVGAVPSPMLIAYVHERTGSYTSAIESVAVVVLCAAALPLLLRSREQVRRSYDSAASKSSKLSIN
jgi:OFA family oxalate/formate antiporter-like MFS transporter